MSPRVSISLAALGLFLLQVTFIPLIGIGGFTPDLLVLWLLYLGIRRGHIEATLGGFAVGLLQDMATTQFFGLAALSKAVAGFIAGYFFNENTAEQTLGSYRYVLSVLLIGAVHNVIYYSLFFQGMDQSVILATARMTVGTTLYTGLIGVLPMFAFARKYRVTWTS